MCCARCAVHVASLEHTFSNLLHRISSAKIRATGSRVSIGIDINHVWWLRCSVHEMERIRFWLHANRRADTGTHTIRFVIISGNSAAVSRCHTRIHRMMNWNRPPPAISLEFRMCANRHATSALALATGLSINEFDPTHSYTCWLCWPPFELNFYRYFIFFFFICCKME